MGAKGATGSRRAEEALVVAGLVLLLASLCGFAYLASSLSKLSSLCGGVQVVLACVGALLCLCLLGAVYWACALRRNAATHAARGAGGNAGDDDATAFLGVADDKGSRLAHSSGDHTELTSTVGDGGDGRPSARQWGQGQRQGRCKRACTPSKACFGKWTCCACTFLSVCTLWVVLGLYSSVASGTIPDTLSPLSFAGLSAPVTVKREANGVIHIAAETRSDAVFAQGVVHAQERLWQMEFQRRVGAGRLAEVAGSAALSIDKQMRTFGFYKAAEAAYGALSGTTKDFADAYAAGVNAYLNSNPHLPLEFWILGYSPEPWRPADSLVWAKLMSFDLSGNMNEELERYDLITLGRTMERIQQLMPPYDTSRYPIAIAPEDIQGGGALPPHRGGAAGDGAPVPLWDDVTDEWLRGAADAERSARRMEAEEPVAHESRRRGSGDDAGPFRHVSGAVRGRGWHVSNSNNWVVGPDLTESGQPLMCNDPHLQLMAPSIWILNHLEAHEEDMSVIGASFAGLPGVVIGHNKHISWAVTNTGADVQDLYIMEEQADHPGMYRYKGEWLPYNTSEEVFQVKGEANFTMTVRSSIYGPVVTDNGVSQGYAGAKALSLHWTSLMSDSVPDTTLEAFEGLNSGRNWEDFRRALSKYIAPSQNFIFARAGGGGNGTRFGYQMPGKIPMRVAGHTGAVPVPGNGDYDWQGFIDFDDLPRTADPKRGYVVTANNRITPENYKFNITVDWDAGSTGYRAARITELVEAGGSGASGKLTVQDMQRIQTDYGSYLMKVLVPFAVNMSDAALSADGIAARDMMKTMLVDAERPFDASIGSNATTVFETWYKHLCKLGGKETNSTYWTNGGFLVHALASDDSADGPDPACKDAGHHSCTAFAADALNTAGELLADGGSPPLWGEDTHLATFKHQVLGNSPLACLADRTTQHGGDRGTINVGHYSMDSKEFHQGAGPSYRGVYDLADLEQSVFLNPLGQSGNILSPHYDDLLEAWSNGTYLAMKTTGYTAAETQQMKPSQP